MSEFAMSKAQSAARALEQAFALRDRYASPEQTPAIGIFGNGVPETLIEACGATPVHLAMGVPEGLSPAPSAIDEVIEPFVDAEVRLFLNRLFDGEFASYRGIVFARDDAPALIAYQYGTEWLRQGQANGVVPPMFLWNVVHSSSVPVAIFNRKQADTLLGFLESVGLSRPGSSALADAARIQARRMSALKAIDSGKGQAISGGTAMRWRNAGRFMSASDHADLLDAVQDAKHPELGGRVRIGLVGSPLASMALYDLIGSFGALVCDLQPWGQVWPADMDGASDIDAIVAATAADPFCPRITPTTAHREALIKSLVDARCDLVICQLAQTDDTFGWEIPGLVRELERHGIGFANLGFRDPEPDGGWLAHASSLIGAALEVRP